ncbi:MAG: PQQ-binding-like beta-propeller repeat protein [Candidatus Korarchaeota archaeon]
MFQKKYAKVFLLIVALSMGLLLTGDTPCADNPQLTAHETTLLWSYATGGAIQTSAAVGDINNDGKLEVVIGSHDGKLYAFNASGTVMWTFSITSNYYIRSSPALVDIDEDGNIEIIFGGEDSFLYVLDGRTGVQKWRRSVGPFWVRSSPAIADLDKDGKLDIIVGYMLQGPDRGGLIAFSGNSTLLWNVSAGGTIFCGPSVADIEGDGNLEVIALFSNERLVVLGSDGTVLQNITVLGYKNSVYYAFPSPAIGDVDGDGKNEIVVGRPANDSYPLIVFNDDYSILCEPLVGGNFSAGPSLGDINNDGKVDIIFTTTSGNVYCYGHTGGIISSLWTRITGVSGYPCGIATVDLNGDSNLDVLVPLNRTLVAIAGNGTTLWNITLNGSVIYGFPTI